jgi:putative spermidine/putrescine transport system permease protein
MEISVVSTIVCLVLAYPLALLMTLCGPGTRRIYMMFLIVPFLTSVLIRMFGWIALLSPIGAIPTMLQAIGLNDVALLYNRFGVIVGMTYALLPYAVFTIYGAMRSIDMTLLRASRSLGANGWATFRRVLLPLTMPGLIAAGILTFVLSLGYFVTPRLMGGPRDQTLASVIENKMELSHDIPIVVALSLALLTLVGIGFAIASRLVGFRSLIERRGA